MSLPARYVRFLLLLAAAVLAVILLSGSGFGAVLERASGRLLRPLFLGTQAVISRLDQLTALPFRAARLERELAATQEFLRKSIQERVSMLELERENADLRKTLRFTESVAYPVVVMRALGTLREAGTTFILFNRGSDQGIAPGQPVIHDGVLLGKIVKVEPALSLAAPLTAPGLKTAAAFAGGEKTAGIAEGELNLNLALRFLPKDIALSEGLTVITSGLEERIPRGLILGAVSKVQSEPQELFQTAYLAAPQRLENAEIVSIVTLPVPASPAILR